MDFMWVIKQSLDWELGAHSLTCEDLSDLESDTVLHSSSFLFAHPSFWLPFGSFLSILFLSIDSKDDPFSSNLSEFQTNFLEAVKKAKGELSLRSIGHIFEDPLFIPSLDISIILAIAYISKPEQYVELISKKVDHFKHIPFFFCSQSKGLLTYVFFST